MTALKRASAVVVTLWLLEIPFAAIFPAWGTHGGQVPPFVVFWVLMLPMGLLFGGFFGIMVLGGLWQFYKWALDRPDAESQAERIERMERELGIGEVSS